MTDKDDGQGGWVFASIRRNYFGRWQVYLSNRGFVQVFRAVNAFDARYRFKDVPQPRSRALGEGI